MRSPGALVALFERGFAISALLLYMGGFALLLRGEWTPEGIAGGWRWQALWAITYATTGFLLLLRPRAAGDLLARDPLLLAFVMVVLVSITWSTVPGESAARVGGFLGTTLFGVYLAVRFGLAGTVRVLGVALGVAAVLSLLFVIAAPGYGLHWDQHLGDWRGVFLHKNTLGSAMALGAGTFLALSGKPLRNRVLSFAFFLLALLLLLRSNSMTAIVAAAVLAIAVPVVLVALRRHFLIATPATATVGALGAGVALWALLNLDAVATMIGRSPTLTGRATLWTVLLEPVQDRPWLGYGFGSFWRAAGGQIDHVWSQIGWAPSHAHNAALEITLALGLVGLGLFLTHFLITAKKAFSFARTQHTALATWPLFVLGLIFMISIAESVLLYTNSIFWVAYTSTSLTLRTALAEASLEGRNRAAPAPLLVLNAPRAHG